MKATTFSTIPARWCKADPTAQLRMLREEIILERDFPTVEASTFMARALASLQRLQGDNSPPDLVLCLMDVGRYYYLNGQPTRAVQASAAAVVAATSSNHPGLEARARMSHGTNLRDANQLFESMSELSRALELFQAQGDAVWEAKVLNNIGNWYVHVGLCAEAQEIFERIAECFMAVGDRVSAWMALDNAATSSLKVGDTHRGIALAEKAAETWSGEAQTTEELLWVVQGMQTYCELLLEAGRIDEAAACARTARVVASRSNAAKAESLAALACAVAEFATGSAGSEVVDQAVERARRGSSHEYGATLETAIRAFERAGQLDKALLLQRELIVLSAGQKFESMRRALGRPSPDEAQGLTKMAMLSTAVDQKLGDLVNTAVTQALRCGHDEARIFRVSRLAELFTLSEGWQQEEVQSIALAARLIDIGMMVVPDEMLRKTSGLSEEERKLVEEHAAYGAELLESLPLTFLKACVPVVRFHHERWDGTGPRLLRGDDIPKGARVVALCDAFDDLIHPRPLRHALPVQSALTILGEGAGRQFEPGLAMRFVAWARKKLSIQVDLDSYLGAESEESDFVMTKRRIQRLCRNQQTVTMSP